MVYKKASPKIGFGMERMPCGQSFANAVFFRIGALAYNLYRLFLTVALKAEYWQFRATCFQNRNQKSMSEAK
jgi:hypothetical protein